MKRFRWALYACLALFAIVSLARVVLWWDIASISQEEFRKGLFETEIQVAEREVLGWATPYAYRILDRKTGRRFYLPDFLAKRQETDPIMSFEDLFAPGRKVILTVHPELHWVVGARDLDARRSFTPDMSVRRFQAFQETLPYHFVLWGLVFFAAIGGIVWLKLRR